MSCAHRGPACSARRGRARWRPPPLVAPLRAAIATVALVACVVVGAGCSSSEAARSTPKATALVIPPPFEVGQRVGFGAVVVTVDSFRHDGDSLTAQVTVANVTPQLVPVVQEPAFSIFYGSERHAPSHVSGLSRPIAANGDLIATLDFVVPEQYQYPLVWFSATVPEVRAETVVLRGAHS